MKRTARQRPAQNAHGCARRRGRSSDQPQRFLESARARVRVPKNMKPVTPEMVRQRCLLSRNGNALACATCGKAIVPKPGSRRQKYCTSACKFKAFRSKKWAERYETPDPQRSVENIQAIPTSCKADFGGRAFPTKDPLNLIGGYSWSDATSVDPKLITKILRTEIGALARTCFHQRPDRS